MERGDMTSGLFSCLSGEEKKTLAAESPAPDHVATLTGFIGLDKARSVNEAAEAGDTVGGCMAGKLARHCKTIVNLHNIQAIVNG